MLHIFLVHSHNNSLFKIATTTTNAISSDRPENQREYAFIFAENLIFHLAFDHVLVVSVFRFYLTGFSSFAFLNTTCLSLEEILSK